MKPKFKFYEWRERQAQSFDRKKITIKKAGKEYNVYDAIQEAREDTEIYPTLEKYGCIDRMMLNTQGVYTDFTAFKDLRTMKEQQEMAEQMFYNLPIETRKEFNNNIHQFVKDGEKWLKNKIKLEEETKKPTIKNEATKIVNTEAEATTQITTGDK